MSDPADQDAIKEMYQRLIGKLDQYVDATEDIKKDISLSREFDKNYCCSDPFYKEQIEVIKGTLPDNVTNGTVGAYLYGCMQPELAVEIGCTPACSTGLRNPDVSQCDIASYEKKNGVLTKLNNVTTEEANVFITGNEEITSENRQQLLQDGIKVITIYNQDGDSINYILGESINLEEPENPPTPPPPPPEETTPTYWGWIWFVLAIIIVIILVVALFR